MGNQPEEVQFADRIRIYKVPVSNQNIHHSSNRELIRYTARGYRLSRKLVRRNDYDFSFAFAGVPAGGISFALEKVTGLPYIVSLQGPDVPGFEARYNYLYPWLRPVLRQIWGGAECVTAISKDHQSLAHQTMPGLEIPIFYNGVDNVYFHTNNKPPERDKVIILCVARLIGRKGQHNLIEAFSKVKEMGVGKEIKLMLVGTGDCEDDLHQMANTLDLSDQVLFTGFVPREEMPGIYQQADIFVLPSQNEGMSIALLEAMASGLPVLVTNTGGTEELVENNVNGFILEWEDVERLAELLLMLVRDDALRQRLGSASRTKAERYSWEEVSKSYLDLFKLINSP